MLVQSGSNELKKLPSLVCLGQRSTRAYDQPFFLCENMMTIRLAGPDDVDFVRTCAVLAFEKYIDRIGREPAPMVHDYAHSIAEQNVFVLLDDHDVRKGFILFYPEQGSMMLDTVAILPECAGLGFGKLLIQYCEAEARKNGLKSVALYTNEKMTENLAMYPKLGYCEIARKHQDGFDRVFFEKPLT